MKIMELNENQSALVLGLDEQGEIEVNVASGEENSLTAKICMALAEKLMTDTDFQDEIMSMVDTE